MMGGTPHRCRHSGCTQPVLPALAGEFLCLDHFLDQTYVKSDYALELCHQGKPLDPETLDSLLADARVMLKALEETTEPEEPERKSRILELLFCIANLHEFVAHHSVPLTHRA